MLWQSITLLIVFVFLCKDTFAVLDHVTMIGINEILYAEGDPLFQIENVLCTVILHSINRRKKKLKTNRKCFYSKMTDKLSLARGCGGMEWTWIISHPC